MQTEHIIPKHKTCFPNNYYTNTNSFPNLLPGLKHGAVLT